jgi:hypothetical protein
MGFGQQGDGIVRDLCANHERIGSCGMHICAAIDQRPKLLRVVSDKEHPRRLDRIPMLVAIKYVAATVTSLIWQQAERSIWWLMEGAEVRGEGDK